MAARRAALPRQEGACPEGLTMIRDAAGVTPTPLPASPRNTAPSPAPAAPPASPPVPNPRLRIEAALNLVVLEFRDGGGEVSLSIPSARELDAYRTGTEAEPQPAASLDVTR
jgi:hypothetical protein